MENSEKSLAKAQQSKLYCWKQTVNFSRRSNRFCDEIKNEFETSGNYNFLVRQIIPIAKSMPKTLDLKCTIFERRIGFLRQNHTH